MNTTAGLVCRAFLHKLDTSTKQTCLSYLPPSQKGWIETLYTPENDLSSGIENSCFLLDWVHFSWLSPFLRSLPENDIRLFLSCLSEPQAIKLKQNLLFNPSLLELSPTGVSYLQNLYIEQLLPSEWDLLPIEALPPSPLNALLTLTTEEIHLLSEFLGIHDLAVEIRQIIDTVKLKKIHACLSKEKEAFLKTLTQKKEEVLFRRMELQKWNGETDTLLSLLHNRGLNRLAKAFFPEDANLIWYIKHRMDVEEATLFSTLCTPLSNPKASQVLSKQITDIMAYMQKPIPPKTV